MRTLLGAGVSLVFGSLVVGACQEPTQIELWLSTDLPCNEVHGTAVTVGKKGELENAFPSNSLSVCETRADGTQGLGMVVLVPRGEDDESVAIKVVAAVTASSVDACVPGDGTTKGYKGCIVARRELRYRPKHTLRLPVTMLRQCEGVECTAESTCFDATTCMPAGVTCNEQACVIDGGDGDRFPNPSGPGAAGMGGGEVTSGAGGTAGSDHDGGQAGSAASWGGTGGAGGGSNGSGGSGGTGSTGGTGGTGGGTCEPETDAAFCVRHGKNCGMFTNLDNCGSSRTVSCGTCTSPQTCGSSGGPTQNVCISSCVNGYIDNDNDGYGTGAYGCYVGVKVVPTTGDCCDQDARVHPNATMGYDTTTACGGWDYNCDGTSKPTDPLEHYPARARHYISKTVNDVCMSASGTTPYDADKVPTQPQDCGRLVAVKGCQEKYYANANCSGLIGVGKCVGTNGESRKVKCN